MLSEINRSYPSLVLIFCFTLYLLVAPELNPKYQFGNLLFYLEYSDIRAVNCGDRNTLMNGQLLIY